jgi:hypothetical protein
VIQNNNPVAIVSGVLFNPGIHFDMYVRVCQPHRTPVRALGPVSVTHRDELDETRHGTISFPNSFFYVFNGGHVGRLVYVRRALSHRFPRDTADILKERVKTIFQRFTPQHFCAWCAELYVLHQHVAAQTLVTTRAARVHIVCHSLM